MTQQLDFFNIFTGQAVTPTNWQANLSVGDHYAIEQPTIGLLGEPPSAGPTVYGRVESARGCQPGYFYVRGYSQWCPEGELGLMCIADPTRRLTQAQFEAARAAGWPDEIPPHRRAMKNE